MVRSKRRKCLKLAKVNRRSELRRRKCGACQSVDEERDRNRNWWSGKSSWSTKNSRVSPILGRETQILGLARPSTMTWDAWRAGSPLWIFFTTTLAAYFDSKPWNSRMKRDKTVPVNTRSAWITFLDFKGTILHLVWPSGINDRLVTHKIQTTGTCLVHIMLNCYLTSSRWMNSNNARDWHVWNSRVHLGNWFLNR